MEWVKKNRKGEEFHVRISLKSPYYEQNSNDTVYCIIYIPYEETKNPFFRKKFKKKTNVSLFYDEKKINKLHDWTEKDYESWADKAISKFDEYMEKVAKEKKIEEEEKVNDNKVRDFIGNDETEMI